MSTLGKMVILAAMSVVLFLGVAYEFPELSSSFDTMEKMLGLLQSIFEFQPVRYFALVMTVPPAITLLWLVAKRGLKDGL